MTILAVVPAFNESKTISQVVKSLLSFVDKVVVVDDASSDLTGIYAYESGALVLKNNTNMGYEFSLNRGLRKALELGGSVVVTVDADGQHPIETVQNMINQDLNSQCHVVVGSRSSLPRLSEKLFSSIIYSKYKIQDILSGLKCYSSEALRESDIEASWNSVGSYITLFCLKEGLLVESLPITVKSRDGKSRFGSSIIQELIILKALVMSLLKGY